MMLEYGLFNDEGCVESGMYSLEEAALRLAEYARAEEEEGIVIDIVCPDHPEQRHESCEECYEEGS